MTTPVDVLKKRAPAIPTYDIDAERDRILQNFDMTEIGGIELIAGRVLVAKWIRTKVGSLHTATQTQKEDGWTGKVGLVLKLGPLAFQNDANHDWHGQCPKVGQWVLYRFSDGADFDYSPKGTFDRIPCKVIEEGDVQMIIPRPDFAY